MKRLLLVVAVVALLAGCGGTSSSTSTAASSAPPSLTVAQVCQQLSTGYPRAEFNVPSESQLSNYRRQIDKLSSRVSGESKAVLEIASFRVARASEGFTSGDPLPNVAVSEQMDKLVPELTSKCEHEGVSFPTQ